MASPSFGTMLRARRLGWEYSKQHGFFIRMSTIGDLSYIELAPENEIPKNKTPGGWHRCWWDDPSILDLIPWLRFVKKVKKYIEIEVDDHGNPVRKSS